MALADNLLEQKIALTALLEAEYSDQNLRDQLLERLFYIRFLLGELAGSGDNSNVTIAAPIPTGTNSIGQVTANAGTNLNTSALALESGGNLAGISTKLPSSLGAKTAANSISVTPASDAVFSVKNQVATASPTTSVASSAASTTLLALNTARKWASFRNDSTSVAYVAKSGTASTSSVYLLQPQGTLYFDDYTGIVTAIWVTANGFMRIEEGT